MTSELVSPYKDIMQYTRVQVLPHMMNSDIESNMELVLQKKVENKCNKYGYICNIYGIEEYEDGEMIPENLLGAVNYNVTYHCKICIPIENTMIIGQVKGVNQELIIVKNGPIIVFIPKTNIDSNVWNISNDFTHKKSKQVLSINDNVRVLINKKKINQGDIQIKCIGTLLDFSNKEDTEKYYGNYIEQEQKQETTDDENKEDDSNFII
jgi:DNA-directed RNA polymerase subunit E'/Rpb7